MNRTIKTFALAGALLFAAPGARGEEAGACRPDFLTPATYGTATYPGTLDLTDLNLDGYPDLLVTTLDSSAALSVRLGAADGTFGAAINRSGSELPLAAAVGAFDADSSPDVIVSGYGAETRFFAGNGDGTFAAEVPVPGAGILRRLAAADMDDDGDLDIVGLRETPANGTIVVLLGTGDGTFGAPHVTTPPSVPLEFSVGDVDGDDLPDVVAPTGGNVVSVFLGLGDGLFGPPSSVIAGAPTGAIALADVNGDADLDMILTSGSFIGVLFGNGDGTFQAARNYASIYQPKLIALGDLDGADGPEILAVTSGTSSGEVGTVFVLTNDGDGTFSPGPTYVAGIMAAAIAAGDFGDDGRGDFAVLSSGYAEVTAVTGNGDGTFQAVPVFRELPLFGFPAVDGDFDEDGRLDVAVAIGFGFEVLRSQGGGDFTPGPQEQIGSFSMMAAADFNLDGHLDIVAAWDVLETLLVSLGNGDATFQPPTVVNTAVSAFRGSMATGDFDGDGIADLMVAAGETPPGNGGNLLAFHANGDGTFDPPTVTPLAGTGPFELLAAPFNADALTDCAILGNDPERQVRIYLSAGDGTFSSPGAYDSSPGAAGMAAADLRHSGHLDLIIGDLSGSFALTILAGRGDGTFDPPYPVVNGFNTLGIDTADFDGDGNLDIVTANVDAFNATVLFGLGDGSFGAPQTHVVGIPYLVFAGDFAGRGRPDAVFVNVNSFTGLTTLLNGALTATVPDASAVVGEAATLSVRAGGFGPLSYLWRKDGMPLSDGGPVFGSLTANLTIDPVSFDDAASYDVLVSDDCGPVTSSTASLAVEFADVPTSSPFHDDILQIATEGITGGCGGGNYCPASPVRRDQMAVFLLKSEHGADYVPPPCTPGFFADVACPGPFADWIQQLAAESITGGCGGGNYCPSQSVTRAQMAIFLLKTDEGSAYTPPTSTGIFGDVPPGSFGADFIEEIYHRGITGGCSVSPLLYCPGSAVLRQQMATFLVRTFAP